MYHDEFAQRPARRESFGEEALPSVALEVGGGLWMAALASLNQTTSALIFQLGGMLPFLACSLAILVRRCSDAMTRFSGPGHVPRRLPVPIPHLGMQTAPVAGSRRTYSLSESSRSRV